MRKFGNGTAKYTLYDKASRILVQDKGEAALRTLYEDLTFDVIKQSPTLANGMYTDSYENGIRWGNTGRPTGDRYRYLGDDDAKDNNRYFYLDENTYKTANTRYRGERTTINVNGTIAAQTTADYGAEYFTTDLLGSVRTTSDTYGTAKSTYTYDAFGTLVQGSLNGTTDYGYLGKQHDASSHLYNYGYRDYNPTAACFTTIDPIRDGHNWFAYCNGDPVNFVDLWGLCVSDSKRYTDNVSGAFSSETYNSTVQLTAELCIEYGMDPQTSVYMHNDITGKICPKYFVNNPGTFTQFKNDVEKEMEKLGTVGYK